MSKHNIISINEVREDEELFIRELNQFRISEYSKKMKSGEKFPPIHLDTKRRIIDGRLTLYAAKRAYGEYYKIPYTQSTFTSLKDLLMEAVERNIAHGSPLDTFDKKTVLLKLQALNVSISKLASIFHVQDEDIVKWGNMVVHVIGKDKHVTTQPLKNSAKHMMNQTITEQEYHVYAVKDLGSPLFHQIQSILSIIKRPNWVDREDENTIQLLQELYDELHSLTYIFKRIKKVKTS